MASVTDGVRDALVGISTGVNSMQVDESIKAALAGTLGQMFVMLDMVGRLFSDTGALPSSKISDKVRFEGDIRHISHQTSMVQGAVVALVEQGEGRDNKGGQKRWNVLESKVVANMKMLGADTAGFRTWHEKLVNIMEQM